MPASVYEYGTGSNTALKKWIVVLSGGADCSSSSCTFGAAWNFQSKLYFASNGGEGIIEVLVDSINLAALTATRRYVAASGQVATNDGFNCLNGLVPFATCGDKNTVELAPNPNPLTDAECGAEPEAFRTAMPVLVTERVPTTVAFAFKHWE